MPHLAATWRTWRAKCSYHGQAVSPNRFAKPLRQTDSPPILKPPGSLASLGRASDAPGWPRNLPRGHETSQEVTCLTWPTKWSLPSGFETFEKRSLASLGRASEAPGWSRNLPIRHETSQGVTCLTWPARCPLPSGHETSQTGHLPHLACHLVRPKGP